MEYCFPLPPWLGNTEPTFANTKATEVSRRPHHCFRSQAATNWRPSWLPVLSLSLARAVRGDTPQVYGSNRVVLAWTVPGTVATGSFGPDLTHLMSRETPAAGAATNTHENFRARIQDSDSIKPGSLMPAMKVNI